MYRNIEFFKDVSLNCQTVAEFYQIYHQIAKISVICNYTKFHLTKKHKIVSVTSFIIPFAGIRTFKTLYLH